MKVSVTTLSLIDLDVDLLLLPVSETLRAETATAVGEQVREAIERAGHDFKAAAGEVLLLYPSGGRARRVGLIGLGDPYELDAEALRKAGAKGAEIAARTRAATVALRVPPVRVESEVQGQALVEGFMLASYQFLRYKSEVDGQRNCVERLVLHAAAEEKAVRRGAERGRIVAESVTTARDLVNTSPHEKTPGLLGKAAERQGKKYGFEVSVWDRAVIEEEGMGGLLAVNRGSMEPPAFIEMTWCPTKAAGTQPVVLVGKGVVFDTGGLSLKGTKDSMDHMKADMAGAAAVIGTMEALARLELPLYVIGLVPATDNRPGQDAYVPGDVLTMHSGKTVEVLNTDAEGRLILADALSYAKLYRPGLVIDIATLTGAQVVALGSEVAAVMTNAVEGAEDRLASITQAARRSGDLVHPMPMDDHYGEALKSSVADIKNIGNREAGTITAAKFLEHFVDYPWLHVDVAGPAFLKRKKPYRPKGATGFGVRLLVEFLRTRAHPRRR